MDRNNIRITPIDSVSRSLSARRAWIEIAMTGQISVSTVSLSARRAWIEIITRTRTVTGCVVALRKESVDRNGISSTLIIGFLVALRKESVDRNGQRARRRSRLIAGSLSARRAWIEIILSR